MLKFVKISKLTKTGQVKNLLELFFFLQRNIDILLYVFNPPFSNLKSQKNKGDKSVMRNILQ